MSHTDQSQMPDTRETPTEIGVANAECAHDQLESKDYASPADCVRAHVINTLDTLREQGIATAASISDAIGAFAARFDKLVADSDEFMLWARCRTRATEVRHIQAKRSSTVVLLEHGNELATRTTTTYRGKVKGPALYTFTAIGRSEPAPKLATEGV